MSEITYTKQGDYLIPDLTLPTEPEIQLGRYAMMHRDYLEQNNYQINRIAVEMNEEILPKYSYSETMLKDGDRLEVVTFVGGG